MKNGWVSDGVFCWGWMGGEEGKGERGRWVPCCDPMDELICHFQDLGSMLQGRRKVTLSFSDRYQDSQKQVSEAWMQMQSDASRR